MFHVDVSSARLKRNTKLHKKIKTCLASCFSNNILLVMEEIIMKLFYKFLPAVLILLICSSSAYSADAPWKKIGESKGIIGYTRPTPLSSVEQVKATGTIDEPIAVVEAVVRDVPAQVNYMYLCKESEFIELPGKQNSADIYYLYNLTDMPGFISDRDCIARSDWKIDKETGIIYSHS
jgi:hypothetical protein